MRSVWSDEIGRIITKVNKISSCVLLTSLHLKKNYKIKKIKQNKKLNKIKNSLVSN